MPEFSNNLWAPWRMEYIHALAPDLTDEGCFLCRDWSNPAADAVNHVLWRTDSAFVVMNRFPYSNGHLMVAHANHRAELSDLTPQQLLEMTTAIRDAAQLLRTQLNPQGFNIGFNIGRCAGAGLPGHLHAHIVPRWNGDTNFMPVIGDVRVIPQSLQTLYQQLRAAAVSMGLTK